MLPGINLKSELPKGFKKGWRLLRSDWLALLCVILIVLLFFVATFSYFLSSDKTHLADRKCTPIANQPPGFEVTMLRMVENRAVETQSALSKAFFGTRTNETYVPVTGSRFEGAYIVIKEFSATGDSSLESRFNIADVVYPVNTNKEITERSGALFFEKVDGTIIGESINDLHGIIEGQYLIRQKFVMGTDRFGRDVMSRLIVGTRATVYAALFVTFIATVAGFLLGYLAATLKSRLKVVFIWLLKSAAGIPGMLLAASIVYTAGNGFMELVSASSVVLSAHAALIVMNRIFTAKRKKFVEGLYALGISKSQVLRRHIVPELSKPVLAGASGLFTAAILLESGLSFLGIGVQDPFPSWGAIVRENYRYMIVQGYAHLTILPGVAISVVSLIFMLFSNRVHFLLKESDRQVQV